MQKLSTHVQVRHIAALNAKRISQKMIEKTAFKKTFGDALETYGYQRRGQTWYKSGDDVISAINLQKSNYSELYYVNVGFFLTVLTGTDLLPTNHSHVNLRAERLLPKCADEIRDLFRLDFQELDTGQHTSALRRFVSSELAPCCLSLLSLDSLCAKYTCGGFGSAGVRKVAVPILRKSSQAD